MRYAPLESVSVEYCSWPSRYSSTDQPASDRSLAPCTSSKFASCQAAPFSTPTPGTPPTSIETLALAVCVGAFQLTTPVLVTVRADRQAGIDGRPEPSVTTWPGCSVPLTAANSLP